MALSGTIGDFGLAEIFQLIGIQRKTGILSLQQGNDRVTVKFLEGNVVEADTGSSGLEDRLGSVLVRTGKITERQLDEALKIQKRTLQRLGHILVRHDYIDEEELVEALRVQSLQIIYRLFRWRDGHYDLRIVSDLDYDQQHVTPIASETILMEGARMVDEWPLIERRIKNDGMIFARTDAAAGIDLSPVPAVDPEVDFDAMFEGALGGETSRAAEGDGLDEEFRRVLALVDGQMTVEEITDYSNLGEFDTQRILCDLLVKGLIAEVVQESEEPDERPRAARRLMDRITVGLIGLLLAAAAAASLYTLPGNPLSPWRLSSGRQTTDRLRVFASHSRLERLEEAIQVHYLDRGSVPKQLTDLVDGGYVTLSDLVDPWGRAYGYVLSPGGYQLFGLDATGAPNSELNRSHRFSPTQQMLMDAALVDR
jgi:hypothetical protein